jgi:hypothetical protein
MRIRSDRLTHRLSSSPVEVSVTGRRRLLRGLGSAAIVALLVGFAGWQGIGPLPGTALARDGWGASVTGLQQSLRQARTELELERSARAAADAQVAALNDELGQLRTELSFMKQQSGRSGAAR